ncbi:MAG: BlaI/MecI/CopY family transcriptional regulator, partial [Flavobacteriales bacterium]|nr:BlaI/MecI/CopY family transcriptional regulator [Flavobacteriales bacterium]
TKREDQIMSIIWQLKNATIREIVEAFPEPQPHYNTVATLVKILVKKEVLLATKVGNTYQYHPSQDFEEYRDEQASALKEKFFDNSLPKMLAHFAKKENLTEQQKKELIKIIKG